MATEQLFTVAGVISGQGTTKVSFGQDLVSRVKAWSKAGFDARFVELPQASTKLEALQYLSSHPDYQDAEANFVIQSKLVEKTKAAKKGEVKVSGGIKAKQATATPVEA